VAGYRVTVAGDQATVISPDRGLVTGLPSLTHIGLPLSLNRSSGSPE
jgi:hypothetical protein